MYGATCKVRTKLSSWLNLTKKEIWSEQFEVPPIMFSLALTHKHLVTTSLNICPLHVKLMSFIKKRIYSSRFFGIHFGIHKNTCADLVSKTKNVCKNSFFRYSKRLVMIFPWKLFMRTYMVYPPTRTTIYPLMPFEKKMHTLFELGSSERRQFEMSIQES